MKTDMTAFTEKLLELMTCAADDILIFFYSQTCVKQAPMGKPKTGCLRQVLA